MKPKSFDDDAMVSPRVSLASLGPNLGYVIFCKNKPYRNNKIARNEEMLCCYTKVSK